LTNVTTSNFIIRSFLYTVKLYSIGSIFSNV